MLNISSKGCIDYIEGMKIGTVAFVPVTGDELLNSDARFGNFAEKVFFVRSHFVVTLESNIYEIILVALIVFGAIWKICWDGLYLKFKNILSEFEVVS